MNLNTHTHTLALQKSVFCLTALPPSLLPSTPDPHLFFPPIFFPLHHSVFSTPHLRPLALPATVATGLCGTTLAVIQRPGFNLQLVRSAGLEPCQQRQQQQPLRCAVETQNPHRLVIFFKISCLIFDLIWLTSSVTSTPALQALPPPSYPLKPNLFTRDSVSIQLTRLRSLGAACNG